MKLELSITITCDHCGKSSPLKIDSKAAGALRAALAEAKGKPKGQKADPEWTQPFLELLFTQMPFGDWFEAADIPEESITPQFTGANPRAQFGLWLTHYSRREKSFGRWFVKRNKPDSSSAQYLVSVCREGDDSLGGLPEIFQKKYSAFKEKGERT